MAACGGADSSASPAEPGATPLEAKRRGLTREGKVVALSGSQGGRRTSVRDGRRTSMRVPNEPKICWCDHPMLDPTPREDDDVPFNWKRETLPVGKRQEDALAPSGRRGSVGSRGRVGRLGRAELYDPNGTTWFVLSQWDGKQCRWPLVAGTFFTM